MCEVAGVDVGASSASADRYRCCGDNYVGASYPGSSCIHNTPDDDRCNDYCQDNRCCGNYTSGVCIESGGKQSCNCAFI